MTTQTSPTVAGPIEPKSRTNAQIKFVVILLVALGLGYISTLFSLKTEEPPGSRFPPFGPFRFSPTPLLQFHTFITTVEIVLLIALLGIYVKVYSDTRARFALGLVGVLAALLLNTILTYPLVEITIGPIGLGPGGFLPFADVLEVAAYILFLYLSLE